MADDDVDDDEGADVTTGRFGNERLAMSMLYKWVGPLVEGSVVGQGFPTGVGEFLVAMEISGSLAALKGAECR